MVQLLVEHGADVGATTKRGDSPIWITCGGDFNTINSGRRQNPAIVRLLVAHGASLKVTNSEGETLLHLAAKSGQLGVAEYLVAAGLNVNARTKDGLTPLHGAAALSHQQVWCFEGDGTREIALVKLLLAHGADINAEGVASVEESTPTQTGHVRKKATPLQLATVVADLPPIQIPYGATCADERQLEKNIEQNNRTRRAIDAILRASRAK